MNWRRASPVSFKHVGQAPFLRASKIGKMGLVKNLAHFGLQDGETT